MMATGRSKRAAGAAVAVLILGAAGAAAGGAANAPRSAASAAAVPYPGTYEGRLWKKRFAIRVGMTLSAGVTTRTLSTRCGRIALPLPDGPAKNGRVSLREQVGRGRIQDNYQTTVYALTGAFTNAGRGFSGVLSYRTRDAARGTSCATRGSFTARLVHADVVGPWDAGHYAGTITGGRPIAFDLTYDEARRAASIAGLSWTVGPVACTYLYEDPAPEREMTTRITLAGPVEPRGAFDIRTPTDRLTGAWGTVIAGRASGRLQVGTLFDAAGAPVDGTSPHWFCAGAASVGGGDFTARRT